MAIGRLRILAVVAATGFALLAGASPVNATALTGSAGQTREAKSCGWDKRDGWISNSRKCREALVIYRAQVRRDGVFDPYGVGCRFDRIEKVWRCSAGKFRTMNIKQGEFSRGYVYRSGDRLVAVVTYPVNPF